MDSRVKLYMERAENKLLLAKTNFDISTNINVKKFLNLPEKETFYNDVISQSYYAIFYSAKSFLISKGIKTSAPEEHKKTYEEFKKFIDSGEIDKFLLEIYDSEAEKAEYLLKIYLLEKGKRGRFTYNINAEANIPYAQESLKNSRKFVSVIKSILNI